MTLMNREDKHLKLKKNTLICDLFSGIGFKQILVSFVRHQYSFKGFSGYYVKIVMTQEVTLRLRRDRDFVTQPLLLCF